MRRRVGHRPDDHPTARLVHAAAGEPTEVTVVEVRAVDGVDESFTGAGARVDVERRLDRVRDEGAAEGTGPWPKAQHVVERGGCEVRRALLHLSLVRLEQFGVEAAVEPAARAEHVRRDVETRAVDADLRVVVRELAVKRGVELEDVPFAVRVPGLAHRHPEDRLEGAAGRDAQRVLHLQHGRPVPTVDRVVKGARVAQKRLVVMSCVAVVGYVGNAEEVLSADRPAGLDVARRVVHGPLGVDALQDCVRSGGKRHVRRVAADQEVVTGRGR